MKITVKSTRDPIGDWNFVNIQETQCHAMGAPACVWEVNKRPKDES